MRTGLAFCLLMEHDKLVNRTCTIEGQRIPEPIAPLVMRNLLVMETHMGIKLTLHEARSAGLKRAENPVEKDESKGLLIQNPQPNYICYIGPCEPGTGAREVCYLSEDGSCDECYLEDDAQCTS